MYPQTTRNGIKAHTIRLSPSITLFADNDMSTFNRALPQGLQEKNVEVRIFTPKFGCINERRNQLHEVIRLSGMNVVIDDADHPLLIKVATLQPGRTQVYFVDNEDFFQRHSVPGLETDIYPAENDERTIFFTRSVIETVKKLRWVPAIIHCGGWISALVPMYLKKLYANDPAFDGSKIVFSLFNDRFEGDLDPRMVEKMLPDGIKEEFFGSVLNNGKIDYIALCKLAIDYSDAVCKPFIRAPKELIQYAKDSGKPYLTFYPKDKRIEKYYDFYKSLL